LTWSTTTIPPIHHLWAFLLLTVITVKYLIQRLPRPVYLVDYACFGPNSNYRINPDSWFEAARTCQFLDDDSISFLNNVYRRSGLGNETCLPSSAHHFPPIRSLNIARTEAELIIFTVIDDLFAKTSIKPNKIDILIVNCSLTTMIPSMTDMIINRYKLCSDIRNM
ncbi:3-ketoacyl-CoA synthase 5, partial [Dichanthelium oligosanthes]